MTQPKAYSFLVTDSKEMQIYDLPDREFKIVVLNNLNGGWEVGDRGWVEGEKEGKYRHL